MVAISVVICNKNAKILFARQFFKLSRMDLEEYIVQFSREIDAIKEVTHFETEKVRYIFIPIENYFLILITTKNSNVIEDTEILKLIYRLIQDICGNKLETDIIIEKSFEIMLGIDDIVNLGYRNGVNLGQIKQYLQMESAEEKEFKRLKREKELKQQKELEEKSREFDRLMRQKKKVLGDAISSNSFKIQEEEKEEIKEEKELNISKKSEDEAGNKEKSKNDKARKGGLKLGKRKNFE